jgi:hypothetical protein
MTEKEKQAKVAFVLKEFKAGTLKSSSGERAKSLRKAFAIALSGDGSAIRQMMRSMVESRNKKND